MPIPTEVKEELERQMAVWASLYSDVQDLNVQLAAMDLQRAELEERCSEAEAELERAALAVNGAVAALDPSDPALMREVEEAIAPFVARAQVRGMVS